LKHPESWSAPVPDYALKGQESTGMAVLGVSYIFSAILGIAVVAVIAWGLGTIWQSRKHKSFWRRTISSLGKTLNSEFITSESASKDGLLQRLDPRTKIVSAVVLVVAVTLIGHIYLLAASIAAAFTFAAASKLRIRSLCAALTPVLILTTALAVPSTLSAVTPGTAVFSWWKLTITDNGLFVAFRFLLGSTAASAWMAVLALSTPWPTLLWAIRSLRVPKVFVLILLMTYRYLFILVRHAEEVHLAKDSRTITRDHASSARQWIAGRAGDLFIDAKRLSDQVYLAMVARGFSGEPKIIEGHKINRTSVVSTAVAAVLAAALVAVDRLAGL
jgi:cobalt/nickel transport system permease protein